MENLNELQDRTIRIKKLIDTAKQDKSKNAVLASSINELLTHLRIVENTLTLCLKITEKKETKVKILNSGKSVITLNFIVKLANDIISIYKWLVMFSTNFYQSIPKIIKMIRKG